MTSFLLVVKRGDLVIGAVGVQHFNERSLVKPGFVKFNGATSSNAHCEIQT
jgi:hypothetical protein